jgi:integrase
MAEDILLNLQSESTKRSYARFVKDYEDYRQTNSHSEAILLNFLVEQSKSKAATTLWTMFSLIKKYLLLECDFDLGCSARITDFLKTLSKLHKKKKAPAFSRDDIFLYLRTAPSDGTHLVNKCILVTGFYAGLRSSELVALTWEDIVFSEGGILVNIRYSKTDRAGVGSVKLLPKLDEEAICPIYYFSKYKEVVQEATGRLFKKFFNGKFINVPIGKNKIAGVPSDIATFLNLENPKSYTGHSLRVTSATVLADEGANSLALKRHGRWTSESVAEEYVRNSKHIRKETAAMLSGAGASIQATIKPNDSNSSMNVVFSNCVFQGSVILQDIKKQ